MKIFNFFKNEKSAVEETNVEKFEKNQPAKTANPKPISNSIPLPSEREIKVETATSGGPQQ